MDEFLGHFLLDDKFEPGCSHSITSTRTARNMYSKTLGSLSIWPVVPLKIKYSPEKRTLTLTFGGTVLKTMTEITTASDLWLFSDPFFDQSQNYIQNRANNRDDSALRESRTNDKCIFFSRRWHPLMVSPLIPMKQKKKQKKTAIRINWRPREEDHRCRSESISSWLKQTTNWIRLPDNGFKGLNRFAGNFSSCQLYEFK